MATTTAILIPAVKLYLKNTELQQMGAIEIPDANCDLLKNRIHPIFQQNNLKPKWDWIWPAVQQILRLASSFLFKDAMIPFWHALLFDRRQIPNSSIIAGYPLEHVSVEGQLDAQKKERTRFWLQHYGGLRACQIGFYEDSDLECHGYCARNPARTKTRHIS